MRIGLVGLGRIGSSHASVVHALTDVDDLVLADADPARASAAAERLGCSSVDTVDAMFAAGLDGVVIASATASHAELVVAACKAGLPTFCEKPVALDVAGTLEVLDQVTGGDVPVQVGFQRRFDRGFRAAREAVQSGAVGDLHRMHVVTADPEPPAADFIRTSGGLFRDCHVHDFDIVRWVSGREIVDVFATGANRGASFFRDAGDVDNSAAVLTLDDGTLVTLQGSRYNGAGYDVRMEVAGSRATYAVGLDAHAPVVSAEADTAFPDGDPWRDFWARFTPAYVAEMTGFVEMVRGAPSPCTVQDALAALYVAEAAEVSRREGRRVAVAEIVEGTAA